MHDEGGDKFNLCQSEVCISLGSLRHKVVMQALSNGAGQAYVRDGPSGARLAATPVHSQPARSSWDTHDAERLCGWHEG